MTTWTTVGTREQVDADNPIAAEIAGAKIGVFEVDGELHAIEDVCPHAHALLSSGFVDGGEVECPLHNAVFDICSGRHLRGEPCRDLKIYPIRVVDRDIQVADDQAEERKEP